MSLSHAYGVPPGTDDAARVLLRAIDLGVDFFDTAALYGFGANESLLGATLKPHRRHITLASKCGMTGVNGRRVIDGRPAVLKQTCEDSLKRLQTDVIDLYYLHRWDRQVPIEESVGALSELVAAGKIREIGLSEVSAATLRRAHAVHPIAAVQSEYSLWTREPEIALLGECGRLGVGVVAFSPLGRGFLTGRLREARFAPGDIRSSMPRFQDGQFAHNLRLLPGLEQLAAEADCTPAQLALSWLLRKPNVTPIPGTTQVAHLEENLAAARVHPSGELLDRLEALINADTVAGPRYNDATQQEIDTETFPPSRNGIVGSPARGGTTVAGETARS